MSFYESIQTKTYITSADVTQYKFVVQSSGLAATAGTAGVRVEGVSITDALSGKAISVAYSGRVPVTAGGTIAKGAAVATTNAGKAATATTGQIIVGTALEAAVNGQIMTIELRLDGTAA